MRTACLPGISWKLKQQSIVFRKWKKPPKWKLRHTIKLLTDKNKALRKSNSLLRSQLRAIKKTIKKPASSQYMIELTPHLQTVGKGQPSIRTQEDVRKEYLQELSLT